MGIITKRVLAVLPTQLRLPLIRRSLRLPELIQDEFQFKIAETRDEFHQAFQILHDSYVDAGFMDPAPSGVRVTPYHCLPASTTFIAIKDGQVVGTMTVVKSGAFGLPMDKIFDLSTYRKQGLRIAEVSALAIRSDFRGHRGHLLFYLIRYMWLHCLHLLAIERLVIAVNPSMADLYRSALLFEPVGVHSSIKEYDFVKGAPAVGLIANLKTSDRDLKTVYGSSPDQKNLYRFIFASIENAQLSIKRRELFTVPKYPMPVDLRQFFLSELTSIWGGLSDQEKSRIAHAYELKSPEMIFLDRVTPEDLSRDCRIEVECPILQFSDLYSSTAGQAGTVHDISRSGFKASILVEREISFSHPIRFRIGLGPDLNSVVLAVAIWKLGQIVGFKVVEADANWLRITESAESGSAVQLRAA